MGSGGNMLFPALPKDRRKQCPRTGAIFRALMVGLRCIHYDL